MRFKRKIIAVILLIAMIVVCTQHFGDAKECDAMSKYAMEYSNGNTIKKVDVSKDNVIGDALLDKQEKENKDYFVSDILIDEDRKSATVNYQALTDVELVVAIYDETEQQMITSVNTVVCKSEHSVILKIKTDIPKFFIAKAYLTDVDSHVPVSIPYKTELYTEQIQQLRSKTVDDFDEKRVVNLDNDKTTNYAVYQEDVVSVTETEKADIVYEQSNGNYLVKNPSKKVLDLKKGDIFSCKLLTGEIIVLYIDSIYMNGNDIVVKKDNKKELGLSDVFETVKIEDDGKTNDLYVDDTELDENLTCEKMQKQQNKKELKRVSGEVEKERAIKYIIGRDKKDDDTDKNISGKISGNLIFELNTKLKVYLTLSYQYISYTVEYDVKLAVVVEGGFAHDFKLGRIEIPTSIPGVVMEIKPSIPLEFKGKGTFSTKLGGVLGVGYDSDTKRMQNKCEYPSLTKGFEPEVTFGVGLKGEISLEILSEDLASTTLENSIMVIISAKKDDLSSSDLIKHECSQCLAGNVKLQFEGKAKMKITNLVELERTLLNVNVKLTDWYFSKTFNEFKFTRCPHKKYKISVKVQDENKNKVVGIELNGTGLEKNPVTDQNGEVSFYEPDGKYIFKVKTLNLQGNCKVNVAGESKKIILTVHKKEDITEKFELFGDAMRMSNGQIRLTPMSTWKGGSAWYKRPIETSGGFTVNFEYYAGGGRDDAYGGADGIVLNLSSATGIGAQGQVMGFVGGYGIELDSYKYNPGDPDGKHIALIHGEVSNHIVSVIDNRVDDSAWHGITVNYKDNKIEVFIDDQKILQRSNINLEKNVYVGLSAATGAGYNVHYVRNFDISTVSEDVSVFKNYSIVKGMKRSAEYQEKDDKIVAEFNDLDPNKSYLIVDAKNLGAPRLMDDDNLLYINQGQSDNQGHLSFVFNKPESEFSEFCLFAMQKNEDNDKQEPTPAATPTVKPTAVPTVLPTSKPTVTPTAVPTKQPTATPTVKPTTVPTVIPTLKPTIAPTVTPTSLPTKQSTVMLSITSGNKSVIAKVSNKKTLPKVNLRVPKHKKSRKLVVRWNAVKGAKGYQLQYALNKKFKKKKSIQTKKTKYTIKKLKKKKTYYIRVRAYKMNGKKKVYGKWSTVKAVKRK